jgi:hypothetical protein
MGFSPAKPGAQAQRELERLQGLDIDELWLQEPGFGHPKYQVMARNTSSKWAENVIYNYI